MYIKHVVHNRFDAIENGLITDVCVDNTVTNLFLSTSTMMNKGLMNPQPTDQIRIEGRGFETRYHQHSVCVCVCVCVCIRLDSDQS